MKTERNRDERFFFNSRPHAEVDLNKPEYIPVIEIFNSRPHAEVDFC